MTALQWPDKTTDSRCNQIGETLVQVEAAARPTPPAPSQNAPGRASPDSAPDTRSEDAPQVRSHAAAETVLQLERESPLCRPLIAEQPQTLHQATPLDLPA